jgi:hypothetical protein
VSVKVPGVPFIRKPDVPHVAAERLPEIVMGLDENVVPVVLLKVLAPLAASVVKLPLAAVVAPMEQLLIVLAVAGLIVTVPVPVGEMATFAFAGESVTVEDAASVVKLPALVPPVMSAVSAIVPVASCNVCVRLAVGSVYASVVE